MYTLFRWLPAAALACTLAPIPAQADDAGPYVQLGAGQTNFDFDCSIVFGNTCMAAHGSTRKIGAGYRFGIFALEVWGTDWGRGNVRDDHVQLRSLGLSGAWRMHFGSAAEGVLRGGVANVQQNRSAEAFTHLEGTFGVGLSFEIMPKVALEIGWDLTTSTGGSDRIGTVFARGLTGGLRARF